GRLVHRPALAQRARPGDRTRRRPGVAQQLARATRGLGRRAPGRRDRAAGGGAGAVRPRRRHARADGRLELLPPPAGEVRSAVAIGAARRVPSPRAGRPCPMLLELSVQNLLLIEDARLELVGGLNVITGETGAGKTVLAHALDLLLGGRARPGLLRPGAGAAAGGLRGGVGGAARCPRGARAARRARRSARAPAGPARVRAG